MSFGGFSGQAYSPAGDKNRYLLPPSFRKAVKESSGGKVLCLDKHNRWNCLIGFGLSRNNELSSQLDREEERALRLGQEFDYDLRASQLFGFSQLPFDESGRFIMPDHLRALGGISDGLYFQGAGRFFTIWNPDQLYEMGQEWEAAQAACASLVSDALAKLKTKGGKK